MPTIQRRRSRLSPAAAAACLLSLTLAALALWGLQRDPLPAQADFGRESETVSVAAPPVRSGPVDQDESADAEVAEGAIEPPKTTKAVLTQSAIEPGPAPVRLRAPALGLDVPLADVGVATDGQMEIPADADRAGWYKFGPRPGDDEGSAVIAGHVDDANGPGAFLALTRAQEGDVVIIDREDGSEVRYTVTARQTTDKKELPIDDLFDRDGAPRLQLVTCAGEWSATTGHYTDNLVLTATPEQQ